MRRSLAAVLAVVAIAPAACSSHDSKPPQSTLRVGIEFGEPPIKGTLTLPATAGRAPAVVMLSGSGPNDQDETIGPNKPFLDLAVGLAAKGIATLRYDKRTRQLPGSIDLKTFTATDEYVPDAVAGVRALLGRAEIDPKRIFVLGHSEGGTMAPKIAATELRVAGVILMAAATEPFPALLLRQANYLASLPDPVGAQAKAQLATVQDAVRQISSPTLSLNDTLTSPLFGGAGPAYFLDLRSYDEVAVARALPQPILVLQGERDYQVTVGDDFDRWVKGLAGRRGVTTYRYPSANHIFIDGSGPPSPLDYQRAAHVNRDVIDDMARWLLSRT